MKCHEKSENCFKLLAAMICEQTFFTSYTLLALIAVVVIKGWGS